MAEFISTFTTGFSGVVEKNLPALIGSVRILTVLDGLVHYSFDGNSRELEKVPYFNNTFFVFKVLRGKGGGFKQLVNAFCSSKPVFLLNKGSFRVRFAQENQFARVDKQLARRAEEFVLRNSRLTVDRLSPGSEIWFSIRSEGFSFCAQLISRRSFTEKNLNKGELRPELAYLMCAFASPFEGAVIAEPFAGYGAVPVQLAKAFRPSRLFVSDIDEQKLSILRQKKCLCAPEVDVRLQDAFELLQIEDSSVDFVITDPPWGLYEDVGDIGEFYKRMLACFSRILKPSGRAVVLSARTDELASAASQTGFALEECIHTLVNGKKAGVFKLSPAR